MTTDLGFGPITYSAFFLGGITLIGLAGVVCLDWFHD